MFSQLNKTYHNFPRRFWVVVGVNFIDGIGGTLLFPFFSLYITQKFGVGMTTAGVILGLFSIFGLIGSIAGGALTDKFGRRRLILFGLVFSALSTLSLGLVNTLAALYPLSIFVGLLSNLAMPAHQAMVADILPEEKRSEGFGILRVVANMSWLVGPTIGGFLANQSFFLLFVADAVISCFVAVLFYFYMPETKSAPKVREEHETMLATFGGYFQVLKDGAFMAFILSAILMGMVYLQMYNSLSVYLRDYHGINPQGYGFLMSSSAITVILFQFWISSVIKHRPPFLMLALGTLFYMLGFTLFGFVSSYGWFVLAVVIITIGEMLVMPTSQTLTAHFAPEAMRGRYMAVYGLVWMIPSAIGPGLAGIILDNYNPNLLWYLGGGLCAISALCYLTLHLWLGGQERFTPAPDETERVVELV
jgi:MFS family permease